MAEWKYCVEDGNSKLVTGWWKDTTEKWYYMNEQGIMQTGWIELEGKWYHLDKSGSMDTGWFQDTNGSWYYLNPISDGNRGVMYGEGTYTIDGNEYLFNSKGVWIENNSLISDKCLEYVKGWEGFIDDGKKYYDCVGVVTQGYGLTGEEIKYLPEQITEKQASDLLKKVINQKYAKLVKNDLDKKGVKLKQNEFDALVSFAYNCGTTGLLGSTLYKRVCAGVRDTSLIANFQAWSNGGGKRIEGLYRRRTSEANMFLYSDYKGNK